jgi:O-antigen ligase
LGTGRLYIWTYLWDFILQRPWFGWGGEGFRAVWSGFPIVQAHNGVLQLLIEWGGVGFVVIGLPLVVLLGRALLSYRGLNEEYKAPVGLGLALVISLLLYSMVDGIFYYGLPLVFLSVGYVLAVMRPCSVNGSL